MIEVKQIVGEHVRVSILGNENTIRSEVRALLRAIENNNDLLVIFDEAVTERIKERSDER